MSFSSYGDRLINRYRRLLSGHLARRPVALDLRRPVVSFAFDDFPRTALNVGGAILEEHGLAGTFYAAFGLAGRDGPVGRYFSDVDVPDLIRRGHELGCHTFDHCHAWRTAPTEYESSVKRNAQHLKSMLPEASFASHSYPIGVPSPGNKEMAARYFACARGGEARANKRTVDASSIDSVFIEKFGGDFVRIKELVDRTVVESGWLIFSTHDVSPSPSRFGCTVEFFTRIVKYVHDSNILVLPVARAFSLLRDGQR